MTQRSWNLCCGCRLEVTWHGILQPSWAERVAVPSIPTPPGSAARLGRDRYQAQEGDFNQDRITLSALVHSPWIYVPDHRGRLRKTQQPLLWGRRSLRSAEAEDCTLGYREPS